MEGHHRNDNVIEDFCDTQAYKAHHLFSTSLQIMMTLKPIGSHSTKHKIVSRASLFFNCVGEGKRVWQTSLHPLVTTVRIGRYNQILPRCHLCMTVACLLE